MPPTLAIVDDDEPIGLMIAFLARNQGWNSKVFTRPTDLLRQEVGSIDALLTDLRMPSMSGLELLAELRRRGWDGPAAMMTGNPEMVAGKDAASLEVLDILAKPVGTLGLIACLNRLRALAVRNAQRILSPANST